MIRPTVDSLSELGTCYGGQHRGHVRIYLDACCLNRLTDDQNQPRIAAEAEAVEQLLLLATNTIPLDLQTIQRAKEFEAVGYGAFDALHLSSAEASTVEVLLTPDDRFIKRAQRGVGSPCVRVFNPVEWLREQEV